MKTTTANDTNMESTRVKPAKPLLFFVLLIMQVFDVLVVIACRACSCHYVRGKSGKDRQFYFPASSLARNADSCNVSYAGANKWGGLRTEAQFQGGQRTYSFQWLRLWGEKERVNLGKPIFIPNVARRALFAINFTYPTLLNWVWLYLARPTGLLQNKDIFFHRSTASLTH